MCLCSCVFAPSDIHQDSPLLINIFIRVVRYFDKLSCKLVSCSTSSSLPSVFVSGSNRFRGGMEIWDLSNSSKAHITRYLFIVNGKETKYFYFWFEISMLHFDQKMRQQQEFILFFNPSKCSDRQYITY